jgi:hypothetical protein
MNSTAPLSSINSLVLPNSSINPANTSIGFKRESGQGITKMSQAPMITLKSKDVNQYFYFLFLKNRYYPELVNLLYDALELQCKQCGLRLEKNAENKSKMDSHMDWHFRQNRRAKELNKRAPSRDWYVNQDEWIKETLVPEISGILFVYI